MPGFAKTSGIAWTFLIVAVSDLSAGVQGQNVSFKLPNGVNEQCVALTSMPDGVYSAEDRQIEQDYCSIDFYQNTIALCPKLSSTSPGTLVYSITQGQYAGNQSGFEKAVCPQGKIVVKTADRAPVSYKMSMNDKNTSGTFSTSSLLYYHFSRYFNTAAHVPASVYRSMDKETHLQRVSEPGLRWSVGKHRSKMDHAGWEVMTRAEKNPASYHPVDELFTADRKQVYGVLISPRGKRYGAEVNGTRESGWGLGQYRDFEKTAAFQALSSDKPLPQAIQQGLHNAGKDNKLRHAIKGHGSPEQVAFWMQEVSEIALMDFIFSQQDRIGNVDYLKYWYWEQDGELRRQLAHGKQPSSDIASFKPVLLKRTQLNDNDAGGRRSYANFTKKAGLLEKLRHFNADTYQRLMGLAQDFTKKGKRYDHVSRVFGLSETQLRQLVDNTLQAASILERSCKSGKLKLDLDAEYFFLHGRGAESGQSCQGEI